MKQSEITNIINSYGYLTIESSEKRPSYYKLKKDGTVLEAIINIESIIEDSSQPNGFIVRTTTHAKAYVPREKRDPNKFVNYQKTDLAADIIDEDVEYEELLSEFSEYILNDGTKINIKTILNQIDKTSYYTQDGEPIYSVSLIPSIKIKKKPET